MPRRAAPLLGDYQSILRISKSNDNNFPRGGDSGEISSDSRARIYVRDVERTLFRGRAIDKEHSRVTEGMLEERSRGKNFFLYGNAVPVRRRRCWAVAGPLRRSEGRRRKSRGSYEKQEAAEEGERKSERER